MDITDAKTFRIENFSSSGHFIEGYFSIKRNNMCQMFHVLLYPNGRDLDSRGYVSIIIYKLMRDIDGEPIGEKDDLSWIFSVIDVNGEGKYFRSVVKENIAHYYYEIAELRFLKRSVLLEQADEFLPGDVLTVRIEMSCMSYTGPTDQRDFAFHGLFLRDASTNDDDNNLRFAEGAFGVFEAKRAEFDPIELLYNLVGFLKIFFSFRKRSCIESNTKAMEIDLLSMTDSMDEVKSTYLSSHPLFQIYMALKEKIRKVYSEPPSPNSADISTKENLYFDKLIFVEKQDRTTFGNAKSTVFLP
ncbi:uncharacterized protein TNIN_229001 [Trichonephila inaurata madagascariensis]|uniref:MATH domain-containing protein n=1 Tax=Trichonephila inaurata madagascariensis TaxID=2747483 RepID=A0A8X6Y5D6_9ARAC|nr:uncharacterized protein TNIN_229001 [Trichonephila inaurata madagascariensis]